MNSLPETTSYPLSRVAAGRSVITTVMPYVSIARPDHWFKNVFMVLGLVLAFFCHPDLLHAEIAWPILWAVVTTCIVASSNYVLNEVLDSPTDRSHPIKRLRPVPSGQVIVSIALVEWVVLGAIGLGMAYMLNRPFFLSAMSLLIMGCIYNIPPVRSKDLPYVDVLSESVNNPIRLLLGWFAVAPNDVPPASLLVAYWMIGAFFMASKRFAEYRSIGKRDVAGAYRKSFRLYDEQKLLISMFFYTTCFALFLGIFIIRYHLELILIVPMVAGFISYYLHIAFKDNSAVQNPERLYRETGLMIYLAACIVAFSALMFIEIPALYSWFNVVPSAAPALWKF
jgi:decaprenyl-phosphate phosphoribosyltransferase